MRDLTQHLTTRADDNHAPPVTSVPKENSSLERSEGMSRLRCSSRCFELNHAPPLVRPRRNFEFQPCGHSQAGVFNALAAVLSPGKGTQHLALIVYGVDHQGILILFAPHAFEPQRRYRPESQFSPCLHISTHFTANSWNFTSPFCTQANSQSVLWLATAFNSQTI